jgi:hypothetical protein
MQCSEKWMAAGKFCQKACNACEAVPAVAPGACADKAPDTEHTCQQQADWGKVQITPIGLALAFLSVD